MRNTTDARFVTARRALIASALAGLSLFSCGPKAMVGPEPNEPANARETSEAEHRAAAKREERRLARHQELYDPSAKQSIRRCEPTRGDREPGEPICWIETINPTEVHLQEVAAHRMRAVEHRKAARELRAVEERACAGLAPDDRDVSPFAHRGDILGVSPVVAAPARPGREQVIGATVMFRPVPGLTSSELQRLVDCHLARNATIGYQAASVEMGGCLLTQPGTHASVRALESGFAVDVTANSGDTGEEIWRRAQLLAAVN